jgi:hypothetical protein
MKRFLVLALMWASAAFGQVFTTLYLPSAGGGLTLNIAAGRAFCGGSVITYAGGTLTMSASATNRVYLNTASSCVPAVKSTAFTNSDIPIATVTTSGSAITLVADARTMFNQMLTSSQVVSSINGSPGSFNFTGPGVSCTGTSCTFTGGSGSGVQYNPTTTSYIVTSFSGLYDDNRSKPIAGAVTSYSCVYTTTSTCTMNFASAHGLVVGGAIDPDQLTGWPYPNYQGAQLGSFQITTVPTSTSVTFTTPTVLTATCASACGTAYDASDWLIWTFAREPFIYGHGTVWGIEVTAQNLDTNFASLTAGMAGTPTILINITGVNDFAAGSTVSQVETWTQNIWQHAHAQSPAWKVMQTTLIPAKFGILGQGTKLGEFNIWMWAQSTTAASKLSGKYFDYYADPASAVAAGYGIGTAPDENVAQYFASTLNNAIASQSSTAPFPPTNFTYSGSGNNNVPALFLNRLLVFDPASPPNQWLGFSANGLGNNHVDIDGASVLLNLTRGGMGTGTTWCADLFGADVTNNNNSFARCFHLTGSGSTSNYMSVAPFGGTDVFRAYATGEVSFPGVATSPSTAPACFNGTHGGITNVGCSSGSGDVVGPASSTADNIATYADTTGRLIKDSGVASANVVTSVTPTSPIVASIGAHNLNISCPTCGSGSGGTSVSQNSGAAETNLPITGNMPQVCSDTSGSGTAQSCTVANTFVPQTGNCMVYQTTTANSGTGLTINVNSSGAKSVAVASSSGWTTTLAAGSSIPANKPMNICNDGTNWNASGTGYAPTGGSGSFQYSALPVPPATSNFTWVNQQSGTTATQAASGAIDFNLAGAATLNWELYKYNTALPATPWSVQIYSKNVSPPSTGFTSWGLYLYDGTKMEGIENLYLNTGTCSIGVPGCIRVERMNSVTSDAGTVSANNTGYGVYPQTGWYLRWCDTGTTRYAQWGFDGYTWHTFYSEASSAFMTPTFVGVGGAATTAGGPVTSNLQGFSVTTGATCP